MTTQTLNEQRLRADVAELLGCAPEDIDADENLVDRGLDSVRLMTLVERWRAAGAAHLEFPDLAEQPEITHWVTVVGSGS